MVGSPAPKLSVEDLEHAIALRAQGVPPTQIATQIGALNSAHLLKAIQNYKSNGVVAYHSSVDKLIAHNTELNVHAAELILNSPTKIPICSSSSTRTSSPTIRTTHSKSTPSLRSLPASTLVPASSALTYTISSPSTSTSTSTSTLAVSAHSARVIEFPLEPTSKLLIYTTIQLLNHVSVTKFKGSTTADSQFAVREFERFEAEWLFKRGKYIQSNDTGTSFMVTTPPDTSAPAFLRLSRPFSSTTVIPSSRPTESAFQYYEIVPESLKGFVAFGVVLGDVGEHADRYLEYPDACLFCSDGRVFGGKGHVEVAPRSNKEHWPIDMDSFGPLVKSRETLGCGWDGTNLFFARYVDRQMIKFVVDGFDPQSKAMWPAMFIFGGGTKVNTNLKPSQHAKHGTEIAVSQIKKEIEPKRIDFDNNRLHQSNNEERDKQTAKEQPTQQDKAREWLRAWELENYWGTLSSNGYNSVLKFSLLEDKDLISLGISDGVVRKLFRKAIECIELPRFRP